MPTTLIRPLTTLALAGVVAVTAFAQPAAQPSTQPGQPTKPSETPQSPAPARDPKATDSPNQGTPATQPAAKAPEKTIDKPAEKPNDKSTKPAEKNVPAYVLNHTVKDINGKDVDLSTYKGKVIVIVNVASKCGFTPQYEGLEELYESRKDKSGGGLVVLGFPANDFGKQEPGTDSEIKEFCETKFKVSFPMFSKVTVKGDTKHPLYAQLAAQPAPIGGEPKWNFTKFVVDQQGNVVARFDAEKTYVGTAQLEPGLVKKVDELLAAKK